MNHSLGYLLVFLGGGIGSMLRHATNRVGLAWLGAAFPWSTLFVNVAGSFVMGLLAGWFAYRGEQSTQSLRLFLTTGMMGGFTTFSTFSLDTVLLWERGQPWATGGYVLASLMVAVAGLVAGLAVVRSVAG